MSLQSSLPMSINQINQELGKASNATTGLADADARWLADVPSGAVSMSNFLNKRSLKIVHQAGPTAFGISHVFNGVNFGPVYPGRRIITAFYFMDKDPAVTTGWAVNGLNIGGDTTGDNFIPHY